MRPITVESIPVNRELHAFPKVVIFELVAGCNLRCVMCPHQHMTRRKGLMKLELYEKCVAEIAAVDPNTEIWATIMGEVFVHREKVFDYVEAAKRAGLRKVYLNTNLVLFEPSMIARLAASRLDKLTIGLDATTRETYDRIRVGGDFEKVERNLHALLEAKAAGQLPELELIVQFIVQDENAAEEEEFKQKWSGKGLTLKIRHRLGWGTGVPSPALALGAEARTMPCPWLMRTMSIHWTGEVAQCDAEWNGDRYVGNLNEQTISEVWLGALERKRQRHLALDFDFEPCRDCNDWQCGLSEVYR